MIIENGGNPPPRKRPWPLWYRRSVLAVASWLDRLAAALRAHVLRHTPRRNLRMTAPRVLASRVGGGG